MAAFLCWSRKYLDYIEGDATSWENEPFAQLAHEQKLAAFRHSGFLATDGYFAGQNVSGETLGIRESALENMVTRASCVTVQAAT